MNVTLRACDECWRVMMAHLNFEWGNEFVVCFARASIRGYAVAYSSDYISQCQVLTFCWGCSIHRACIRIIEDRTFNPATTLRKCELKLFFMRHIHIFVRLLSLYWVYNNLFRKQIMCKCRVSDMSEYSNDYYLWKFISTNSILPCVKCFYIKGAHKVWINKCQS